MPLWQSMQVRSPEARSVPCICAARALWRVKSMDWNWWQLRHSSESLAFMRAHSRLASVRRLASNFSRVFDKTYLKIFTNSIKYADFNGPGERSWQARYDLDLAPFGLPGLSFMARYVSGRAIDGSHAPAGGAYNPLGADGRYRPLQGSGGKHWERDLDLRYLFASGPFKDLSLNVSHLSHRANAAQANSFEALPFYLAAMLWALSQQVPMPVLDLLAGAWIASRCAYIACYWHDLSTWRSIVWLVAQLLSLAVFTSPLWGR